MAITNWAGTVSTDWNTGANWSPFGVPASTDDVTIGTTNTDPTLSSSATVHSLNITGNARLTPTGDSTTLTVTNGITIGPTARIQGTGIIAGDVQTSGTSGFPTIAADGGLLRVTGALTDTGHELQLVTIQTGDKLLLDKGGQANRLSIVNGGNFELGTKASLTIDRQIDAGTANVILDPGAALNATNSLMDVTGTVTLGTGATLNGKSVELRQGGSISGSGKVVPTTNINTSTTNANAASITATGGTLELGEVVDQNDGLALKIAADTDTLLLDQSAAAHSLSFNGASGRLELGTVVGPQGAITGSLLVNTAVDIGSGTVLQQFGTLFVASAGLTLGAGTIELDTAALAANFGFSIGSGHLNLFGTPGVTGNSTVFAAGGMTLGTGLIQGQGLVNAPITVTGAGQILGSGGTLVLNGPVVDQGHALTLTAFANSVLVLDDATSAHTVDFKTFGGIATIELTSNGTLNVGSQLTVAGTLKLDGKSNSVSDSQGIIVSAEGSIQGAGRIDGSGGLVLDNQAGGTINANNPNGSLTIGALNSTAQVTNDGILEAEGGTLVVSAALTNNNLVTATAGGTVILNGAVSGAGTLKADGGTLTVNGDAAFGATAVITNGGTLQALGNFQANVTFQGAGMLVLPEVAITQGGYIGHISGWGSTDTLDITSLPFKSSYDVFVGNGGNGVQGLFVRDTAAMDSAGNPQIVAELLMNGSLVSRNFSVADDKHGGTIVSEHDAGPVPVPGGLTLAPASDTGTPGDNVTTVRTPTITGTGEVGDTVTLLDGTTVLGSATVDPKGNWSMTVGTPLATGQHSLTATEADPNGVASSASSALPLTILSKAVNDFDGDGKSGLLWRNTGSQDPNLLGTVSVWEAIAPDPQKPGFVQTTNAQNVALVGTDWKIVGTGDFNADGKTDVLWRNIGQDPSLSGAVSVWEMNGFKTVVADYLRGSDGNPVQVPLDLSVFGTPDVNGDGMSDILWRNLAGTVEVTLLNGTTPIETDTVQTVGTDFSIVGSGDFDGDRKGDILWRNNDGTVAIWEMNGGQIKAAQNIALPSFVASNPTAWSIPVTADYDGDGKTDILWRKSDGTVGISLMNGFQSRGDAVLGTVPTELTVVGAPDINGDGRADVLWRNAAGSAEVSLVNGTGFIETDTIEPNPVGTEYSIVGQPTASGPAGGDAGASTAATGNGGTNASATAAAQSIVADTPTTVAGAANVGAGPTSVAGNAASVTGSQPTASLPRQPAAGSTTVSGGGDTSAATRTQPGFAVAGTVTVWGGAGVSGGTGQSGAGQGVGNPTVTGFGPSGGNGISFPNETAAAVNQVITSARTANGSTMLTLPDGSTLTLAGVDQVDSRMFR